MVKAGCSSWDEMTTVLMASMVLGLATQQTPCKVSLKIDRSMDAKTFYVAVVFEPDLGWHTYFSNPGDSGIAPDVKWTLPKGAKVEGPVFGTPSRIEANEETSFGYEGRSALYYKLTVPGNDWKFSADVKYLVCQEACLPGSADFSGDLREMEFRGEPGAAEDRWRSLRSGVPASKAFAFRSGDDVVVAVAQFWGDLEVTPLDFFPVDAGVFSTKKPEIIQFDKGLQVRLKRSEYLVGPVTRVRGILTFRTPDWQVHSVNIDVPMS